MINLCKKVVVVNIVWYFYKKNYGKSEIIYSL